MVRTHVTAAALLSALLAPTTGVSHAQAPEVVRDSIRTQYQTLRLLRVAGELERPWAVAFLPDGRMLVTERPGRLWVITEGTRTRVTGVPPVHVQNQGGLLDVAVHPNYAQNGWIYLTYSKGDSAATVSALGRARLEGSRLIDFQELFQSNAPNRPGRHYGSRILFLPDGTLLMTIGDRGTNPDRAQDTRDHSRSIVRLNDDGSVPPDNPFAGDARFAPEIYSYGRRNIQALVRQPETGDIWAVEHGPRGSDELNLIVPGRNYGWPEFTLGRDYRTQEQFGESVREPPPGIAPPVFEFLPTLAPSGGTVISGDAFHETWQGNILAGGLAAQRILRIVIEDREVVHIEELLYREIGRIRDVRQGPDGFVYVLTDEEEGGLYRMEPRASRATPVAATSR